MPEIDVLVPYATKNYVKNPSFETNTTGWNAVGSSISAVMTRARFERKSLKVETSGLGVNEGVYYRISDTTLKGNVFASVYIRGAGKVRIKIKDGLTGKVSVSLSVDLHDEYWQRIWVQGYAEGTDDTRLYVETADTTQDVDFYIDGAQVELGDYLSTYCDGYQPDCRWDGVKNASTSQRFATSPNGGRWVSVRDDDCNPTTYITTFSGMGLPPITINRQQMALTPGSFFDSMRVNERVIQFGVNIKDDYAQRRTGTSHVLLNKLRQHLIDLVKPDRDPNSEPMWLRYRDGDRALLIRAIYESGLEYDGDFRNKWVNTIPLRFLALDPFWYEDSQEVDLLDTETPLNDVYLGAARIDGEWQAIAQGFGLTAFRVIETFAEDENGTIYIGGSFLTDRAGNNLRRLAVLSDDYSTMSEVLTGMNGNVNKIVAHPNGKIYIGGEFTGDNAGNTYNYIVEYDPVADTFSALGSGMDAVVEDMDVAPDGDLYVVGDFTTAGGVAAPYIAKWDGGTWERVGDIIVDIGTPTSAILEHVAVVSDSEVYVRGLWANGTTYYALTYDGTTWSDWGTSSGLTSNSTNPIKIDVNGTILTPGTPSASAADAFFNAVYRWNGSSYERVGEFFQDPSGGPYIRELDVDNSGRIFAVGRFNQVGDRIINRGLSVFNGSVWTQYDFNSAYQGYAVLVTSNGDLFIGFISTSSPALPAASGSGIKQVSCKSTTDTFPILSISGTQRLIYMENQTTGQIVYFDYVLQDNEVLELDFRTGIKSVKSNYRGNVPDAILPNSNDISLLPRDIDGDRQNKIAFFSIDEVDPIVQLRYQPTHWSVDAISNQ